MAAPCRRVRHRIWAAFAAPVWSADRPGAGNGRMWETGNAPAATAAVPTNGRLPDAIQNVAGRCRLGRSPPDSGTVNRMSTTEPLSRASNAVRALGAARSAARCLMAGLVVALLVVLAALPDDASSMPASPGRGTVSMKAAPASGAQAALTSWSSSEADVPPGDGRDLGPALPAVTRVPVPAGFSLAGAEPPPPVGSALPERPPKAG